MIVAGIYIDRAGVGGGGERAQDVRKEGKNTNIQMKIEK